MTTLRSTRRTASWLAGGLGVFAGAYLAYVGVAWCNYGNAARSTNPDEEDSLLDRFIPEYEVVERHHIRVSAPADVTLLAAINMDLQESVIVRSIFRTRALVLGADASTERRRRGLLADMTSLGWGVLAEVSGREIVVGAVTQPWTPDVTFRALPPADFAAFRQPGYVKIVWTLRADPAGPDQSIFRTETRVIATDAQSRARFRRYWSFISPGVWLIRRLMLMPLKRDAERRAARVTES